MRSAQLLGVPVHSLSFQQTVEHIQELLQNNGQYQVVTVNNEMLVAARSDAEFHHLLNTSAFNPPDSTGVVWMGRLLGQGIVERVSGVDIVTTLCTQLSSAQSVFLLGAAPGVADKAAATLKNLNPHLSIVGTSSASPCLDDTEDTIAMINNAKPTLLLVAYGAPVQDKWIYDHLSQLSSVRVAIGVGGTFDFLAGVKTRAPHFFRALGLEWLWRLILEPRRIGRILNAVAIFPLLILRYGKRSPHS